VVNELNNVIVASVSSSNPMYQFVEACINSAIEEDNMDYVDLCLEAISDKKLAKLINSTHDVGKDAAEGMAKYKYNGNTTRFGYNGPDSKDPIAEYIKKGKNEGHSVKMRQEIGTYPQDNVKPNNPALANSPKFTKPEKKKEENKQSSGGSALVPVAAEKPKTSVLDGKPQLNFHGKEAQPNGNTTHAHLFGTHNYGIPGINTGKRAEEAKKEEKGKTSTEEQPKQNQQQQQQQSQQTQQSQSQQSTKNAQEKVKEAEKVTENTPKGKIAQLIAALKKYYTDFKDKINKTDPKNRTIFQKVMSKILSVIDRLTGFLKKKSNDSGKPAPATA
jgi:hypothetical protein